MLLHWILSSRATPIEMARPENDGWNNRRGKTTGPGESDRAKTRRLSPESTFGRKPSGRETAFRPVLSFLQPFGPSLSSAAFFVVPRLTPSAKNFPCDVLRWYCTALTGFVLSVVAYPQWYFTSEKILFYVLFNYDTIILISVCFQFTQ